MSRLFPLAITILLLTSIVSGGRVQAQELQLKTRCKTISAAADVLIAYVPIGLEVGDSVGIQFSDDGGWALIYGANNLQRAALMYWEPEEPCTIQLVFWNSRRLIQIRFDRVSDYYRSGSAGVLNRPALTFYGAPGAVCTKLDVPLPATFPSATRTDYHRLPPIDESNSSCVSFLLLASSPSPEALNALQYIHSKMCPALKIGPY